MVAGAVIGIGLIGVFAYLAFSYKDAFADAVRTDEEKAIDEKEQQLDLEKEQENLEFDKKCREVGYARCLTEVALFGNRQDPEEEAIERANQPAPKVAVKDYDLAASIETRTGGALTFNDGKIRDTEGNPVQTTGLLQSLPIEDFNKGRRFQ